MSDQNRTHLWQGLFLTLLLVCVAQSSYWVLEQIGQAKRQRDAELSTHSSLTSFEQAIAAGEREVIEGASLYLDEARSMHGRHLQAPDPALAINDEYDSRRRRVLWEGAFFIVVLFGAMGVITRALRESQNLVQRQQNFIASVTHELRTPLTSLKLSADTLALRAPDKEASLRLAERMSDDVERLDQMVSQLLESARIEAKATRADPTAVNLYPLLQAEVHALHCRLAPHGVLLQLDCPPELHVSARPMDLKMVITNLLSNAVKSCEVAGGGAVHVAVTTEGRHAKIQFSDDGVGFDPAEAARIFERFYRPGDELRRETIGSGLGLYIVRELSRAHGGSIDAESSGPGQGATLTLTWPTADTPPSA